MDNNFMSTLSVETIEEMVKELDMNETYDIIDEEAFYGTEPDEVVTLNSIGQ